MILNLNVFLYFSAPATLEIMSQNNQTASGRVHIPREARTDDWWALAVRLPCKPSLFQVLLLCLLHIHPPVNG